MLKLLIAEDEIKELEWLSTYIKEHHSERLTVVGECTDGVTALKRAQETKPDIVFLDIQMPLMNGIDVAKTLKQQDKFVNIVFLTAFSTFEYAHEALKIGALDYLLKPYDPKEIDILIDKLIPTMNNNLQSDLRQIVTHMNNASTKSSDNPVVRLAIEYIEDHYSEKISLEMLSESIGFSSSYVSKCLNKHLGKNFNSLLLETRCKVAVKLLTEDRLTVNEVAYRVGFSDPNYFTKCFKSYFGDTPKNYSNTLMGKMQR